MADVICPEPIIDFRGASEETLDALATVGEALLALAQLSKEPHEQRHCPSEPRQSDA